MCVKRLIWTTTLESHRLFMYITLKFPLRWQTKHIYYVEQNSRGKAKWMNNFSSKALVTWAHTHIFAIEIVWFFRLTRAFGKVQKYKTAIGHMYIHCGNKTQMQSAFSLLLFWCPFCIFNLNEHKITILTKCYLCSGFLLVSCFLFCAAFTIRHFMCDR